MTDRHPDDLFDALRDRLTDFARSRPRRCGPLFGRSCRRQWPRPSCGGEPAGGRWQRWPCCCWWA